MEITTNKVWYKIKPLIPKQLFEPLLNLNYFIESIGYIGNKVHCPVCGKKFRKFKSDSCPGCGAGQRHRVLWLFLLRKTNFFSDKLKVLHFAPEHCFSKKMKRQSNIEYLSADLHSQRAMVKIDMTDIHYPDNSFDVVISSHVLVHIEDDLKAMKELCRIQKKEGWSIHIVPIHYSLSTTFTDPTAITSEDRQRVYGHYDQKRSYGTDYKQILESNGFIVEIIKAKEFCNDDEIAKMSLDKEFEIYLCKK